MILYSINFCIPLIFCFRYKQPTSDHFLFGANNYIPIDITICGSSNQCSSIDIDQYNKIFAQSENI